MKDPTAKLFLFPFHHSKLKEEIKWRNEKIKRAAAANVKQKNKTQLAWQ